MRFNLLSNAAARALGLHASSDEGRDPDQAPLPGEDGDDDDGDDDTPQENPPAPTPAPDASAPAGTLTIAQAREGVDAAREQGHAQGVKAERERTEKVLSSKEGMANSADAAFMLANTDATADKIIAQLARKAPAASTAPATQPIANTDLNLGDPTNPRASAAGGEGQSADEIWDASDRRVHGSFAPVVPAANVPPAGSGVVQLPTGY